MICITWNCWWYLCRSLNFLNNWNSLNFHGLRLNSVQPWKKDKTLLLWLFLVYFTNTNKRCQIIYVLHLLDFLNHIYFRFAHLDIKTRLKTTILPAHACTFKTRTLQIFPVSWSGSQQVIPIPFPGLCSDFPPQLELYVCVFI